MVAEEQAAVRKKDQSSVLGEAVAQNLKVKKGRVFLQSEFLYCFKVYR